MKGDAKAFTNLTVPLVPKTDPDREAMIRSSRWGNSIEVELQDLPSAVYKCFCMSGKTTIPRPIRFR